MIFNDPKLMELIMKLHENAGSHNCTLLEFTFFLQNVFSRIILLYADKVNRIGVICFCQKQKQVCKKILITLYIRKTVSKISFLGWVKNNKNLIRKDF